MAKREFTPEQKEHKREIHRKWAAANREHRKAYMREWAVNHKGGRREYHTKRNEANPERRLNNWDSWFSKNKERRHEYHKKRHADHPEIGREKQRRNLPKPTRPCPKVCECCGRPPKKQSLCLDHCHATETFRGWLCGACNRSIGQLGDNLTGVQRAVVYLRKALRAAKRAADNTPNTP